MKKALISVFKKEGITDFAKQLTELGYEILSTGGTAKTLKDSGIKVKDVSDYTGFPEMMDGRVKTLHPKIHGGLLALRDDDTHMFEAHKNEIEMIDLVCVNLYPFAETVKKKLPQEDTIEMIDIGGPSMLRSAAKNFKHVLVIVDPNDYQTVIDKIKAKEDNIPFRQALAKKVFEKTASYDAAIMRYLQGEKSFPEYLVRSYKKKQVMRYGENPYQDAAFYISDPINEPCISNAEQLAGKEMSFNNIMDGDAALELVKEFKEPCVAVIKHANPSGVAVADSICDALKKAYNADSLSAFGCVIAMNRKLTKECAEFLKDKFIEVIIAEDYDKEAYDILAEKKNRRLLKLPNIKVCYTANCKRESLTGKSVVGGLLVRSRNFPVFKLEDVKITNNSTPTKEEIQKLTNEAKDGTLKDLICVTEKKPTPEQLKDMVFAMKVCRHVKSNTILYAKDLTTVGIGAGQMSRVDASIIATRKSGENAQGSVMASDAFFPFRDGIDEAAKAGITAIIHPGGSIRDKECIDAANEHGIAMIFTGTRLFLH